MMTDVSNYFEDEHRNTRPDVQRRPAKPLASERCPYCGQRGNGEPCAPYCGADTDEEVR
jgi:hypothetical protein